MLSDESSRGCRGVMRVVKLWPLAGGQRENSMSAPDLSLLGKRRLGPMFVVQFFGAFNDTLLKFAMLFLATFTIYAAEPHKVALLATIAGGVFILPFFLFSALAGQFADKWDKAWLMRAVKAAEIGIMCLALAGFAFQSVWVLLFCLFLMGMHSTIFGQVKYSILPQHLGPHEVMGGTGLVEAGTLLAILGSSWVFAGGTILVTVFPGLFRGWLGAGLPVVSLFLVVFSVAIALG